MAYGTNKIKSNPITAAPFEDTGSWKRSLDKEAWKEYRPAAYRLQMVALPEGAEFANQMEWTVDKARADRLTLIGTQGEMWNVAPEKVAAKYCHIDGTPITLDEINDMLAEASGVPMDIKTIEDGSAPTVWAFQTDAADVGTILTDWGALVPVNHGMVEHGNGDWLVVDSLDMVGVDGGARTVNGLVFADTYMPV